MDATLTDQIYHELADGLERGRDYDAIRVKYEKNKGPFYNALARLFADLGTGITRLASEKTATEQEVAKAKVELNGLRGRANNLEAEVATREKETSKAEKEAAAAQARINELEDQLETRAELLRQAQELEKLGFDGQKLGILHTTLVQIGAQQGLKGSEAVDRFFSDLKEYDASVGFAMETERLQSIIATKRLEAERWAAEADSLELKCKDRKAVIDDLGGLLKQGVKTRHIVAWSRILKRLGIEPEKLQQELEAYSDMQGTLNAKLGETKDCEASIARLKAEIKALDGQKREIEFSIKDLATSGVDQIKRVGQEARGELESLKVEIKKWGEIKAEAGKLEQELKFARYLTAIDAEVIRKLPGEIAILLVDRIRLWCEFRAVNPKVKAGEGVHEVCYSIPSYAEIGPIHLLEWARRGLLQGMEAK